MPLRLVGDVRDRVRGTKQGALRSGRNTENSSNLIAMNELMFQQAHGVRNPTVSAKEKDLAEAGFF